MIVSPPNPNIIADSPIFIKQYKPLSSLEAPVYAQKQEMVAISTPKTNVSQSVPGGSCSSWMSQAGIALTPATNKLIINESGCNPTAQNPKSTAYGIGQFLDATWSTVGCVKSSDPVYQLQCMQKYVNVTYGSWDNALAKWYSRCGTSSGCWY